LLQTISGLHRPAGGTIWFDGERIDGLPGHLVLRRGIAHCPEGRRVTLADLRAAGTTILLVEQNARAALALSDYGYVIETGRVTLHGPGDRLLGDERVRKAYLGED
jgi:ABC-type branched-subunit amino acid transport system ATPase component